jgi:hypothetical protein
LTANRWGAWLQDRAVWQAAATRDKQGKSTADKGRYAACGRYPTGHERYTLGKVGDTPGESLGLPHSRLMPDVGRQCHELRIPDEDQTWRIVYRTDPDAIVVLEVFSKKSPRTPKQVTAVCRQRQKQYDELK